MIASGEKKQEYREIKPYWTKRLEGKDFHIVRFKNGYSKDAPVIDLEFHGFRPGYGKVDWGAPYNKEVYVIDLGEIIE